jgi:ubiquinone/menaquinone biosynthesis C-methylase UbiE
MTQNLSHTPRDASLEAIIKKITLKIKARGDLPYVTVSRQLELLHDLSQFGLGRFLLQHGGIDGYWTQFVVKKAPLFKTTIPLEDFFFHKAPLVLATQSRYEIFKREIQKRVKEGIHFASIPCGLMDELFDLDFSNISDFTLTGIDLDQQSLIGAQRRADELSLSKHCEFLQEDAWNLSMKSEFDLIVSHGLTIYEHDDQKVIDLYRIFLRALKSGGCLVTSYLSPPSEWNMSAINSEDALVQRILTKDIIDLKCQAFRSASQVHEQLKGAGFKEIEILYDPGHIFPTVIAN